jgi:hypothetical protein
MAVFKWWRAGSIRAWFRTGEVIYGEVWKTGNQRPYGPDNSYFNFNLTFQTPIYSLKNRIYAN